MSRAWLAAILLALLLHLAGALSREARAEDPADCEPLDAVSLEAVIERLSLDAEQSAWLRERLAAGELRAPEDLADLPGLSTELRDELEAAWCWSPPVEAEAMVAARVKPNASRQEATVRLARGGMEVRAKARRDGGGESALRGAVRWARGEWTFAAGSVRARQGLGLLVVTAGDEPRGDAPLEPAGGMWRPSLAFDARAAVGIAAARQGERWSVGGAVLRSRNSTAKDATPRTWSAWRAARKSPAAIWGVTLLQAPSGLAGGIDAAGEAGQGVWSAEWRRGGSGNAVGASWGAREGPWRVRASLTHVDAGYAISAIPAYREGEDDDLAGMSAEARWQGGPSRFLRVLVGSGRDPGPYGVLGPARAFPRPWRPESGSSPACGSGSRGDPAPSARRGAPSPRAAGSVWRAGRSPWNGAAGGCWRAPRSEAGWTDAGASSRFAPDATWPRSTGKRARPWRDRTESTHPTSGGIADAPVASTPGSASPTGPGWGRGSASPGGGGRWRRPSTPAKQGGRARSPCGSGPRLRAGLTLPGEASRLHEKALPRASGR